MDVAEIAFHLAVSRSRIGYRAAFDCADIDIVLFGVVGQVLDFNDLVSHFKDSASAVLRIIPYMAAAAEGFNEETPAAFSLDDQGMIREACFKVECALGAFGFLLDDFRRIGEYVGRFFIGNKDDFAREIIKSGCMERFQSGEQDADAALHIKNARAVCLAVFNGERTLFRFAFEEYRIHVTHEDRVWFGQVAAFADDRVTAFFIGYAADGESQLFKDSCAEIAHLHAAFLDTDAGIDGHHLFPQIDHVVLMRVNPFVCFISCRHNLSSVSKMTAGNADGFPSALLPYLIIL